MPKFVGRKIEGSRRIEDNAKGGTFDLVRLTYSQARKLPAKCIMRSLDTTDRGGRGSYAKRWYRWFASSDDILRHDASTANMRARALAASDVDESCSNAANGEA